MPHYIIKQMGAKKGAQMEISLHLPLVRKVAYRMMSKVPKTVDIDDLISAGVLGLIGALRQFDEKKGIPFDKYAEMRIRGAMLDELRAMDQMPRTMRKRSKTIVDAMNILSQELGRAPSLYEVARKLGIEKEDLEEAMQGFREPGIVQLEEAERGFAHTVGGEGDGPESLIMAKETAKAVMKALESITAKQRQVVIFHYFEGLTFPEIAEIMEITEGRVSQLHASAMKRLRRLIKRKEVLNE
jgi:RNA polymerase sigma factor for flagellar operon FliA